MKLSDVVSIVRTDDAFHFRAGDVVAPKVGGPTMVIDAIRDDGSCQCLWFVGGTLFRETFDPQALWACVEP